ncbi:MAG: Holliday junction branch migration protein RuvA [Clostridia bacterium]|nr:Holliday junction branch migration protein RuvA [Clostridia bacterium]
MFYYIKGPLTKLLPSTAVVEAGGVGYCMTVSETTHASLAPLYDTANPKIAKLYIYMAVREDGVELFGFYSEEELSAFRMLITVSGVGPKAAISILSTLTPEKLALAICTEDRKALAKANGIGAKTAARVILELKDKLSKEAISLSIDSDSPILNATPAGDHGKLSEATDALMVLGYSRAEALNALKSVNVETMPLEDIIRAALKKLM